MPIKVLWYAVPDTRPFIPPSHFRPHWFEAADGWVRLPGEVGVGTPDIGRPKRTDAREWQVAPGAYNVPQLDDIEGTDDEWAHGTLYSRYIVGGYGPMRGCVQAGAEMIIGDRDALLVGGGRSEGASMVLSDRDGLLVGVGTGGSVPVSLDDEDGLGIGFGTGGAVPAATSDRDGLGVTAATGGRVESLLCDRDTLTALHSTGGGVTAPLSDRDTLRAEASTGGSVGASLDDRDSFAAEGAVSSSGQAFAGCSSVPLTLYIHFSNTAMCATYAGGVVTVTSAGGGGVLYSGTAVIGGHTIHGKIREHSGGGVEMAVWETSEPLIYQTATVTCSPFTTQTVAVTPDFCMLGLNIQGLATP